MGNNKTYMNISTSYKFLLFLNVFIIPIGAQENYTYFKFIQDFKKL